MKWNLHLTGHPWLSHGPTNQDIVGDSDLYQASETSVISIYAVSRSHGVGGWNVYSDGMHKLNLLHPDPRSHGLGWGKEF